MSMPFNKPTIKEPTQLLPLPTYQSLAALAEVKPGSIGKSWVFANLDTSWKEALKYTQEMSTEEVSNEAGI